jgi:hypothetical protein
MVNLVDLSQYKNKYNYYYSFKIQQEVKPEQGSGHGSD